MAMRNRPLPGRHITDCQMRLYMSFRQTEPPVIAAKAGFSAATAYRIEQDHRLPSQKKAPRDRPTTRSAGRGLGRRGGAAAEEHPGPAAGRHFRRNTQALSRDRPRRPGLHIRRTLERRIRTWRALNGAEQDVIFRQEHPHLPAGTSAGRLGLSDFTDMGGRGISIAGG